MLSLLYTENYDNVFILNIENINNYKIVKRIKYSKF